MSVSTDLYNKLAPYYRKYSEKNTLYLEKVNKLVRERLPNTPFSMIDLGTGDGVRIKKIISQHEPAPDPMVLVDNSEKMIALTRNIQSAHICQQDFSLKSFHLEQKFDIVCCLWNVLGHIDDTNLKQALLNMKNLLKNNGSIILDINNRQNIKQYGKHALLNILKDFLFPSSRNGDIYFKMKSDKLVIPSFVHLFSKKEIESYFKQAGLLIKERIYINYKTGQREKLSCFGQLFYVLGKND